MWRFGLEGIHHGWDPAVAIATRYAQDTPFLVQSYPELDTPEIVMMKITDGVNTIYVDQSEYELTWGPNYVERKGHQGRWGYLGKISDKRTATLRINIEDSEDAGMQAIIDDWDNGTELEVFYATNSDGSGNVQLPAWLQYCSGQVANPEPNEDGPELRHNLEIALAANTEDTEYACGWAY